MYFIKNVLSGLKTLITRTRRYKIKRRIVEHPIMWDIGVKEHGYHARNSKFFANLLMSRLNQPQVKP